MRIGLVLDGGGAKGAYQFGVLRAFYQTGYDSFITAVAGSSVGSLNAALFCQGDWDLAKYVWQNDIQKLNGISLSSSHDIQDFLYAELGVNGTCSQLCENVRNSSVKCFATVATLVDTSENKVWKTEYRQLNNKEAPFIKESLISSAAIAQIRKEEENNGGVKYVTDGGTWTFDNSPLKALDSIIDELDYIVIVHLNPSNFSSPKRNIPVIEMPLSNSAAEKLDGNLSETTLNFDQKYIDELMYLGYSDAIKWLRENPFFEDAPYKKMLTDAPYRIRSSVKHDYFNTLRFLSNQGVINSSQFVDELLNYYHASSTPHDAFTYSEQEERINLAFLLHSHNLISTNQLKAEYTAHSDILEQLLDRLK